MTTSPITIQFLSLPHGAGLPLPAYATDGAAGMDVVAAEAVTLALNTQIKNGNYAKTLSRWSLESEAIQASRTSGHCWTRLAKPFSSASDWRFSPTMQKATRS